MSNIRLFINNLDTGACIINASIRARLGDEMHIILFVLARDKPKAGVMLLVVDYHDVRRHFSAQITLVKRNTYERHAYEVMAITAFKYNCDNTKKRRCFVSKTARHIMHEVLSQHTQLKVNWSRCCRPSPLCHYVVQFDETDFMFVKRLMSVHGYSYYWEVDTMIIIDDVAGFCQAKTQIMPFHTYRDYQWCVESCRLIASTTCSVAMRPSQFNTYQATYLSGRPSPAYCQQQLEHLAVRAAATRSHLYFASQSIESSPGRCLPVEHPWVAIDVVHHFYIHGQVLAYENQGVAVPADKFYPLPFMPAPLCDNTHKAKVVDIEAGQLCRVRLRFSWDQNQEATPWAPVVQAGGGDQSGIQFMPCLQDVVLVRYEGGDLTCPVVIGMRNAAVNSVQVGHPYAWLTATPARLAFSSDDRLTLQSKRDFNLSSHQRLSMSLEGQKINTWRVDAMHLNAKESIELCVGSSRLCLSQSGIVLSANKILLNSDDQA